MAAPSIIDALHLALAGRADVRVAVLFGSQARGSPAMVHAAAMSGVRDLEAFAREVAHWIAARSSGRS